MCSSFPFPSLLDRVLKQQLQAAGPGSWWRLGAPESRTSPALAGSDQLTWQGPFRRIYYGFILGAEQAVDHADLGLRLYRDQGRLIVGDNNAYANGNGLSGTGGVVFSPTPMDPTPCDANVNMNADIVNNGAAGDVNVTLFFIEVLAAGQGVN